MGAGLEGNQTKSTRIRDQQMKFRAAKSRKASRGPLVEEVDMLVEPNIARVVVRKSDEESENKGDTEYMSSHSGRSSRSEFSVRKDGHQERSEESEKTSDVESEGIEHRRGARKSIVMHVLTGGSSLIREKRKSTAQDTAAARLHWSSGGL